MRFDPCIISVISVVVLLIVKFVGEYSLLFVCSVYKSFVGQTTDTPKYKPFSSTFLRSCKVSYKIKVDIFLFFSFWLPVELLK